MNKIMKNYGLLLDRGAWCSVGGGDRHSRASPDIRVGAIAYSCTVRYQHTKSPKNSQTRRKIK